MKLIALLLIVAQVFIQGYCYAEETETKSSSAVNGSPPPAPKSTQNLFQLHSRNFDSSVSDGNVWLIEFYAPWCSHCMRFEKKYQQVAQKLNDLTEDKERRVKVGKVDGSAEKALASRFSVRGYPVFFLIDGWTVREYEGQRSVDALVKFSTEDYEDVEPIPFINSPFGPMGQLRSLLMGIGSRILDAYEYLVETKSLSPAIASIVLGGAGIMMGVFVIISVGLLLESKLKKD